MHTSDSGPRKYAAEIWYRLPLPRVTEIQRSCTDGLCLDLNGSGLGNCLKSSCCQCCELIQTEKELDYIAMSQTTSAGYQAPSGMVAKPKHKEQSSGTVNV